MLSRGSSVTDVALDLGYQNTSTLIAIFRKQFGMSPTRYMKMEKENASAVSKPPKKL
ncbi:MAG: helix-turn-helix domain-containing protein [Pseudobdellovibrionaceae bacterium]